MLGFDDATSKKSVPCVSSEKLGAPSAFFLETPAIEKGFGIRRAAGCAEQDAVGVSLGNIAVDDVAVREVFNIGFLGVASHSAGKNAASADVFKCWRMLPIRQRGRRHQSASSSAED